jgi:hypothetical protein
MRFSVAKPTRMRKGFSPIWTKSVRRSRKRSTIADLTRLEGARPAAELEKLKGPLAHLQPAWFVLEKHVTSDM